ncbi:MAG: four helix bundle protein [Bacteroidetes bacterium]|nr:MAG: four helix bundle protein [Bacteroidota bacterium]
MTKRNIIVEKSFALALAIIEYSEILEQKKKYVIAKQILRAGTSIGANIKEAQSGESKLDFIHKLKIADKEAHELQYWLELCQQAESYPCPERALIDTLEEVIKLLSKIIATTKSKL